jgi:fructokinase
VFTVIGEALLDMVQSERGGAFVARPGGGPMNIAIGLHRLGHPTHLMARLSDGALGRIVRDHLEANGLPLGHCVTTSDQTTLAFASLDDTGRASYDFYVDGTADWGWTVAELDRLPATTQVLHTGSLATCVRPGADAVLSLFVRAHAGGSVLTSYDPNVRPALAGNHTDAVARVESFVAAAHVVKASDEDVGWLYPGRDPLEVLRMWTGHGPALAVLTRGPEGCVAVSAAGVTVEVPGQRVDVVDTIGAGDAFESGLLSGLADGGAAAPAKIASIGRDLLSDVLERAGRIAALTCRRAGADPPTRAELDEPA